MKPVVDERIVQLLEEVRTAAAEGLVQDVFIVYRLADSSYGTCYRVADLPDMLCEVRGQVIKAQTERREPTQH